ncbi:hypothetical protein APY03_6612 [Variovorax sp. WDL1]|nr:hypothetical protein APY03_6612 [Variovorax sp. WDL1]
MQECNQVAVVVAMALAGNQRIGLEYGFKPLASAACLVSHRREMHEMLSDLTPVPGEEDRFDAREVFVQRRSPDPGLLGNLGHRYREQAVPSYQRRGRIQDRIVYGTAVYLDRLVPQFWHYTSIGAATASVEEGDDMT